MIEEAKKDTQSATPAWELKPPKLQGVIFKECKNIITANSIVKEVYRRDWEMHDRDIKHIISVTAWPDAVLAWHQHLIQTDHVVAIDGTFTAVLFDDREGSPTYRQVEVLRLSNFRPGVLVIPPGVWHGFKNITGKEATFLNYFDREYQYDDPDEYRLPWDTDKIPYRF
jgi:dTDP-4-dehydrorhamnose 3,5-epimerase